MVEDRTRGIETRLVAGVCCRREDKVAPFVESTSRSSWSKLTMVSACIFECFDPGSMQLLNYYYHTFNELVKLAPSGASCVDFFSSMSLYLCVMPSLLACGRPGLLLATTTTTTTTGLSTGLSTNQREVAREVHEWNHRHRFRVGAGLFRRKA